MNVDAWQAGQRNAYRTGEVVGPFSAPAKRHGLGTTNTRAMALAA
jgi:hypothetical protein